MELTFILTIIIPILLSATISAEYVRPLPRNTLNIPFPWNSKSNPYSYPQQVHISLAGEKHMRITWITDDKHSPSFVEYGTLPGRYDSVSEGEFTSYSYLLYSSGMIHHTVIGPLEYGTVYFYRCGGQGPEFELKTPPAVFPITFAVAGDLGQTGWTKSTLDHIDRCKYDVYLLPGDLSYADCMQHLWDSFGRLVEPLASARPWMVTQGNHEQENILLLTDEFVSYNSRWKMPFEESGSTSNLYYSFEVAGVHVIMLGSYADYGVYSEQYRWLKEDLSKVDRKRTPWLLVLFHVPWYNSNKAHQGAGDDMMAAMEPLLYAASVDLVLAGHVHAYERSKRVYNGRLDPCGAVHITIGDGGNREGLAHRYINPQPKWSEFREASFGHGELKIVNSTHAFWSWHRNDNDEAVKADDIWITSLFPGPTESLAASLKRGLQIIDCHQRNSSLNKSSNSFSFGHLSSGDSSEQTMQQKKYSIDERTATLLCGYCRKIIFDQDSNEVQGSLKSCNDTAEAGNLEGHTNKATKGLESILEKEITRENELENVCKEQAARIDELNQLVEKLKGEKELNFIAVFGQEKSKQTEHAEEDSNSLKDEYKLLRATSSDSHLEEKCEIKEVREELPQRSISFDSTEKEELLKEIQNLRSKLQLCSEAPVRMSTDKLKSSLISRSIQLRKSGVFSPSSNGGEELEKERERWTEMESEWICLTDELRVDLEANRQRAERVEQELRLEKMCTEELDDALKRSVLGHARMVEHYVDLQEKFNDLIAKHNAIMHGIAEVKKAAAKAGKRGHARFAKALAAELSALRVEREREAKFLKKENTSLKIQLRDTAEAVHAAGELLVRLREAEHAASVAEDNFTKVQQDNEKLKKQMDKLKRKHKMELITMKQYIAESKLPDSALKQLYREDSDVANNNKDDDQAWRAEFGAIYQEHY